MCVCVYSVVSDSATPWTVAHQVPLSIGFSRQEYWCVLPLPPSGHLPNPESTPASNTLLAILYHSATEEALNDIYWKPKANTGLTTLQLPLMSKQWTLSKQCPFHYCSAGLLWRPLLGL